MTDTFPQITEALPIVRVTQSRINAESISRNWQLGNKADKYSNARRWAVALPSLRASQTRGAMQIIANAIYAANNQERPLEDSHEAPTDTVERLARAYKYFIKLLEVDCYRARQARRKYGYTRFAVLWDLWLNYEFDVKEHGFEYLELTMGNLALSLFVENAEDETPEWKRRSAGMYSSATKLLTDYGVPKELRTAAELYVTEYDKIFPKVTKDLKRKI